MSPNSGGLVFTLFANLNTKIIEINIKNLHQISEQFANIANFLKISYYKFIADKIDNCDNMIVDINSFITFLMNILK